MRIIKHGVPPSEKLYEAMCNKCGTVIEFKAGEAKRVNDQRDGDYLTISCPICYNMIFKGLGYRR
jgi:hypothetical protein